MNANRLLAVLACWGISSVAWAQDEKPVDANIKQREVAENLLKLGKIKFSITESEDIRLITPYDGPTTTKIITSVQKTYTAASKALNYDGKEDPIPGKLTLYAFNEAKVYKIFLLQAMKRSPRGRTVAETELKGDVPFVVLNAAANVDKPTEADLTNEVSRTIATALLNYKAGMTDGEASLPGWLEQGFAELSLLKADTSGNKYTQFKTKVKALATKTRGQALQYKFIWGEGLTATAETDLVTTSFMDYLVFGPGASSFATLLASLKPVEGNDNPTIRSAFEAVSWKWEDTETAWRTWVLTGK